MKKIRVGGERRDNPNRLQQSCSADYPILGFGDWELYVRHLKLADPEPRPLHDHFGLSFWELILRGGMVDRRSWGTRELGPGNICKIGESEYHATDVVRPNTWLLCLSKKNELRRQRLLVDGEEVDARGYFKATA